MIFPLALHWIVLFCGSLFTGNCMLMGLALFRRKITVLQLLTDWVVVYAYLTNLFISPSYLSYVKELAVAKTMTSNFGQLLLKGIPANTLVCMYFFLTV